MKDKMKYAKLMYCSASQNIQYVIELSLKTVVGRPEVAILSDIL